MKSFAMSLKETWIRSNMLTMTRSYKIRLLHQPIRTWAPMSTCTRGSNPAAGGVKRQMAVDAPRWRPAPAPPLILFSRAYRIGLYSIYCRLFWKGQGTSLEETWKKLSSSIGWGRVQNLQPVRLAGGWWLVLVCSERKVWWLISQANRVLIVFTSSLLETVFLN
jgi:hypothetical protein